MTGDEAIDYLKHIKENYHWGYEEDALEMAIKALEQCEVWNGIHGQVVAPKGTFDRIWNDAEKEEQEPKTDRLYNWLNDMRLGIAPDETVTDIDERNVRIAQTDLLDEIMEWLNKNEQEPKTDVLDKIRDEIEQTTSRYCISRERGGSGQVEWSDRLIKESEVLEIIDKYREEQGHYEKLTEHYNSKKDEIKPNPELWSVQDVTDILIKQGLMKRVSETDILDKIRTEMQDYSNSFVMAKRNDLASAVSNCIRIIDKSKAESEDKE